MKTKEKKEEGRVSRFECSRCLHAWLEEDFHECDDCEDGSKFIYWEPDTPDVVQP